MDYLKLLYAAQVNELAHEMRKTELARFHASLSKNLSAVQRDDETDAWVRENPLSKFVPIAHAALLDTAEIVVGIEAEKEKKAMSGLAAAFASSQ